MGSLLLVMDLSVSKKPTTNRVFGASAEHHLQIHYALLLRSRSNAGWTLPRWNGPFDDEHHQHQEHTEAHRDKRHMFEPGPKIHPQSARRKRRSIKVYKFLIQPFRVCIHRSFKSIVNRSHHCYGAYRGQSCIACCNQQASVRRRADVNGLELMTQ